MNANDSLKVTPWEKEASLAPTPPEDPKEKKANPTNQDRGDATSENTNTADLKGERPAGNEQESGKRQEGEGDVDATEKSDIIGKQVDDYFGDTGANDGKGQLN